MYSENKGTEAFQDYKRIQWDYFVPLDEPGGTIDRCIESLNLDKHYLMAEDGTPRTRDSCKNIDSFLALYSNKHQNSPLLFLACFYKEDNEEEIGRLVRHFNNFVKPIFHLSELVVFYSLPSKKSKVYFHQHVPCENFKEYERKVARHLELLIQAQPSGSPLNPKRSSFSDIVLECDGIEEIKVLIDEPFTLRVIVDNVPFEMYCHLRSNMGKLVVFGQDALNRSRVELPVFFRWSWLENLAASGIVLNDPTLYLSNDLNGGWFAGTAERDYVQECSDIIMRIAEIVGVESPPIFFGVSAGGFASLAFASCIKGAKAIVDIPQVDLTTYYKKDEANKLALCSFSVCEINLVPESLRYRVNIIDRFKHQKRIPDILYLHNIRDVAHIPQFNEFLKGWSEVSHNLKQSDVGTLQINTYNRWSLSKGGHFPLVKEEALKRISLLIEN